MHTTWILGVPDTVAISCPMGVLVGVPRALLPSLAQRLLERRVVGCQSGTGALQFFRSQPIRAPRSLSDQPFLELGEGGVISE